MAVGFFTQGIDYTLPHPPISQRIVLLLCKVIKRAWQLLEENPPSGFLLQSADEDTITQVLVEIIENRLRKNGDVDGFNCALFGKVSREPKITNVDKKHPDKMPDIFFDLKRDQLPIFSDQDGLFVECKPVDGKHPILSCYCKKGLLRFVNGDYAWAMQNALMVGYVKHPYSFVKLASVLDDGKKSAALKTTNHSAVDEYAIYRSTHKREFEWPESCGQACPITVSHLWLSL
ncbi:MAG: hypothetical protein JRG68_04630 [Deltaproteobacteria bacterium]|nr:hypothetical protein [Deltaproteobacteria bacterium]MBW2100041.1 hypothetical protein [Deltaproteobacteria bacterium]